MEFVRELTCHFDTFDKLCYLVILEQLKLLCLLCLSMNVRLKVPVKQQFLADFVLTHKNSEMRNFAVCAESFRMDSNFESHCSHTDLVVNLTPTRHVTIITIKDIRKMTVKL